MSDKELAKKYAEILIAWSEGKEIEFQEKGSKYWNVFQETRFFVLLDFLKWNYNFRVSSKQCKFRPYTTASEFIKDLKEHGPFVRNKDCEKKFEIPTYVGDDKVCFGDVEDNFSYMFVNDCWQDGHPCGVCE